MPVLPQCRYDLYRAYLSVVGVHGIPWAPISYDDFLSLDTHRQSQLIREIQNAVRTPT